MRIETKRSSAPEIVAVNETIIASADIAREVQNHEGGSPVIAWEAATRALVVRELLSQRARVLGLMPEPRSENGLRETDEEALIRMLLEAEVRTPTADEPDCRRYYNANLARFRSPDLYEPLHILFKAPQDDQAAYAVAVERATAALEDVKAAPANFENLARALSNCPSAAEVDVSARSPRATPHPNSRLRSGRLRSARFVRTSCARATAFMSSV